MHKPSRISRAGNRHICATHSTCRLWLQSGAIRILKAFYETLLHRHKAKLQALMAVARKLLPAIYGILRTQTPYDGSKLFPHPRTA